MTKIVQLLTLFKVMNMNMNRTVSLQNGLYPFWSIFRDLRYKLLNIRKIIRKFVIHYFDHNFRYTCTCIPVWIMSQVSLERPYFVLYDSALTFKMSKMALKPYCDENLQIFIVVIVCYCVTIKIYRSLLRHKMCFALY